MDSSFTMVATAFLVFYRFKTMSKEEAERAKDEWHNLKNGLPSGNRACRRVYSCMGDGIQWFSVV